MVIATDRGCNEKCILFAVPHQGLQRGLESTREQALELDRRARLLQQRGIRSRPDADGTEFKSGWTQNEINASWVSWPDPRKNNELTSPQTILENIENVLCHGKRCEASVCGTCRTLNDGTVVGGGGAALPLGTLLLMRHSEAHGCSVAHR